MFGHMTKYFSGASYVLPSRSMLGSNIILYGLFYYVYTLNIEKISYSTDGCTHEYFTKLFYSVVQDTEIPRSSLGRASQMKYVIWNGKLK